jgi:hypothetical protein
MRKYILFAIFIILFIGSVSAFSTNQLFTNGITCYQEFANVSTSCGGQNDGLYSFSGSMTNQGNMVDGDYSTYGSFGLGVSDIYINYTIPTNAGNNSLWQVKTSYNFANLSLANCFDNSNKIKLRIHYDSSDNSENYSCYNGSWINLQRLSDSYFVYEEAVIWNYTYTYMENLTFTGNQNIIRWLQAPQGIFFTSSFMNLSFINSVNITENVSASGVFTYVEGAGNSWSSPGNAYDGDWETYASPFSSGGQNMTMIENLSVYGNYSTFYLKTRANINLSFGGVPNEARSKISVWNFTGLKWNLLKDKGSYSGCVVNGTVLSSPTFLCTYSLSSDSVSNNKIIMNITFYGVAATSWLYEESSIFGEKNISNVNLSLGNSQVWYNQGLFTQINNRTTNFASLVNSYSCSYTNGKCYIPITFHSDTPGILQYSDLYFYGVPFIENSQSYNAFTYETSSESYLLNISYDQNAYQTVVANLIYNGTSYPGTQVTTGSTILFNTTLDIPLISTTPLNNSFYWQILLYNGTNIDYYNSTIKNQTVNQFSITRCSSGSIAANFTILDETNGNLINGASNQVTFQSTFGFWLGGGSITKNYSYQEINSTNNTYLFCVSNNFTYKTNLDAYFTANSYSENNYYLRNSTITNLTNRFNLYLLPIASATKFTITITKNSAALQNAVVTVDKYFTGSGVYKATGIKITDSSGKFTDYLDLDKKYRFYVVKDGIFLGYVEKDAICSAAPCEIAFDMSSAQLDILGGYASIYAQNIISSLTFDKITKIVTYNFIDTTGTANYFRLVVSKISYNSTAGTICDTKVYTPAGSISCNLTGVSGDFIAKSYVSRSPEKLDKQITDFISSIVNEWGLYLLLFSFGIILTTTIAAIKFGGGNPSTVAYSLAAVILLLKIGSLFPFSWGIVAIIELGVIYLGAKMKT